MIILISIYTLICTHIHTNDLSESKVYDKQVTSFTLGFIHSHQLSSHQEITAVIKPYIEDACLSIPVFTKLAQSSALINYYISYQNYLLQPLRYPGNIIHKIYTQRALQKAESALKEDILILCKETDPYQISHEECDRTIYLLQRMIKELVELEKIEKQKNKSQSS